MKSCFCFKETTFYENDYQPYNIANGNNNPSGGFGDVRFLSHRFNPNYIIAVKEIRVGALINRPKKETNIWKE